MTSATILAIAGDFNMTERHASPFGSPHYVHDAMGAELELIVSGQNVHASLLFEAESMSRLNRNVGKHRDDWTPESLRECLLRLARIRESRADDAILAAELEDATA